LQRPLPPRPSSSRARRSWWAPAALSLLASCLPVAQARAEGVVERVARTGELVMVGGADQAPLLSWNAQGQPEGYGVVVGERIAAELSQAVGRPVRLRVEVLKDPALLGERIASGQAALACGVPFSWERDMTLDYSLPIALSGLRLMAPAGKLDGSPASLAGRRIGVVQDSLADTELRGMQPAARPIGFPSLKAAVAALAKGQVDGVIGDSILLASLARTWTGPALALTPEEPYERYASACVLPENDSAFRNLVNLAIARLLQGYVDGEANSVATINRYVGPGSTLNIPVVLIRAYYESVLLGLEALRPLPVAPAGARPAP